MTASPRETDGPAAAGSQTGMTLPTDHEIIITRVFDAPRRLVYEAWTDPKHMAQWWGPRDLTNPVCTMDVRPGGAYRIVMHAPDGVDYPIKGVFHEVVPPERLVMTIDCSEHNDAWHDMVNPGRDRRLGRPALDLLLTVTFEERGGKTTLTMRQDFRSGAIRDGMLKMGMRDGWSQSLDKLTELLAAAR